MFEACLGQHGAALTPIECRGQLNGLADQYNTEVPD